MALPMIESAERSKAPPASRTLTSILREIDGSLIVAPRPELASLVNWGKAGDVPIHRWYRYREGFSPRLIEALGLGTRILDPFCGCGSIMVGAAQQNRSAVGMDVNPLAAFAARVKLAPLSSARIGLARRFCDHFEFEAMKAEPSPIPDLRISDKVFEPAILDSLMRIRAVIESRSDDKPLRDFLLLAWLSILQDVGSYFKEGNGIKYRNKKRLKSGYETRTEGAWQLERFGLDQSKFVNDRFRSKLSEMLADVDAWKTGAWSHQQVIEGNAIEEARRLPIGSFDSVVFSPPYANRFDYFESMKVELWFGGFVHSYEDLNALRKRSLRSHLGAALDNTTESLDEVQALIDLIDPSSYAIRMRVPALLHGYFEDMYSILRSCRAALKPGGDCNVVVGNSAYGGVIIPTDSLIARLGIGAGFDNAKVVPVRHLTVAPQQRNELKGHESYMRESVVVLS